MKDGKQMRYVALLRGINVGGNRKIGMQGLKELFLSLGLTNVVTYLNSGNVIFNAETGREQLQTKLAGALLAQYGEAIPVLIKTQDEIRDICSAIPDEWHNDSAQKTDVAFLFRDIDTEDILNQLPVKTSFADIRYRKGAVIWHVRRENYNKSQLNKIIGSRQYQMMTVRNVNTARFLAQYGADKES